MYPEQAGRPKNSELIFIFRILPLLITLCTRFETTIVCRMSNRAKDLDFFKVKAKIVQYQGKAQKEKEFFANRV